MRTNEINEAGRHLHPPVYWKLSSPPESASICSFRVMKSLVHARTSNIQKEFWIADVGCLPGRSHRIRTRIPPNRSSFLRRPCQCPRIVCGAWHVVVPSPPLPTACEVIRKILVRFSVGADGQRQASHLFYSISCPALLILPGYSPIASSPRSIKIFRSHCPVGEVRCEFSLVVRVL